MVRGRRPDTKSFRNSLYMPGKPFCLWFIRQGYTGGTGRLHTLILLMSLSCFLHDHFLAQLFGSMLPSSPHSQISDIPSLLHCFLKLTLFQSSSAAAFPVSSLIVCLRDQASGSSRWLLQSLSHGSLYKRPRSWPYWHCMSILFSRHIFYKGMCFKLQILPFLWTLWLYTGGSSWTSRSFPPSTKAQVIYKFCVPSTSDI